MTLTATSARRPSRPSSEARPSPSPLYVAYEWIRAHCVVPDGPRLGEPFEPYAFQRLYLVNFYLVRPDAEPGQRAPAFVHRRGLLVGPQKVGKNPIVAAQVTLEGVGPALFDGWAGRDEGWVCADHGCPCGWSYAYDEGEAKGAAWPTPLIQLSAMSEEAVQNTYDVLRPMIELGPLASLIPKTGEEFIRLPGGGRIDAVTASAQSRLGQRVTFVAQDEVGLWTVENRMVRVADTQYRGLAGMSGRATLTTNAWDPGQHSVAQQQYESPAQDIWRQFTQPPASLSYTDRRERHRIHRIVYPSDTWRENGGHLELDAIEAEANDLVVRDPAQAARFYGNKLVAGGGKAFDPMAWEQLADRAHVVPDKALVALGYDGSRSGDHSALIACEIATGFLWPLGIWDPAAYPGHEIPRADVDLAVDAAFARFTVPVMLVDPPYWREELAAWQGRYGDKVVLPFETYRPRPIGAAVRAFAQAIASAALSHDGSQPFGSHIGNSHRRGLLVRDDKGEPLWTLSKESPDSGLKIDAAMAAVLAWEARAVAIADGVLLTPDNPYEDHGFRFVR